MLAESTPDILSCSGDTGGGLAGSCRGVVEAGLSTVTSVMGVGLPIVVSGESKDDAEMMLSRCVLAIEGCSIGICGVGEAMGDMTMLGDMTSNGEMDDVRDGPRGVGVEGLTEVSMAGGGVGVSSRWGAGGGEGERGGENRGDLGFGAVILRLGICIRRLLRVKRLCLTGLAFVCTTLARFLMIDDPLVLDIENEATLLSLMAP